MSPRRALARVARLLATPQARPLALVVLLASCIWLVWQINARAWLGEDAFISFRTVDHFVHGNGLRWNFDERVQAFTNPLWVLAAIPFYAVTRSLVSAMVSLSLLCSAGAYLTIGSRLYRRPAVLLLGLFAPMACSETFLNWGTSGFENPMTHLAYALFAWVFLTGRDRGEVSWGLLSLTGSLAVTNRLDTVLVFIPPIAYLLLVHLREVRWGRFLAGFVPIVSWLLFATFYYGFPYPNTALAKVNEEIPRAILLNQGFYYVVDLLFRDPAAFAALAGGVVLTVVHAARGLRGVDRDASLRLASLGAGGLLYTGYVVWIGGSYISGRHLLLGCLVGVVLWSELLLTWARRGSALEDDALAGALLRPATWAGPVAAAGLVALVLFTSPQARPRDLARKIADPTVELDRYRKIRAMQGARMYRDGNGQWQRSPGAKRFWGRGERMKGRVAVSSTIGLTAIAAGRDVIIIDRYALADPLLARLPPKTFMMAGHFKRRVPRGYKHARLTGSLERMDPELAAYYRPLRSIVQDPLFSWDRIREIVAFNLGRYDHYLDAYVARHKSEGWSIGTWEDED